MLWLLKCIMLRCLEYFLRVSEIKSVLTCTVSSNLSNISKDGQLWNGRKEIKHLGQVHVVPTHFTFSSVHFTWCLPKQTSQDTLFWFFLMAFSQFSHLRVTETLCVFPVVLCLLPVPCFAAPRFTGPGFCAISPDRNSIWKDAVEFEYYSILPFDLFIFPRFWKFHREECRMCVDNKFTVHVAEGNCALLLWLFPLFPLFSRNAVSQGIVDHELSKILFKGLTKPVTWRKSFPEIQPSVRNSPSCLESQKQRDMRKQKSKIRELMNKRLTLIKSW